MLFFWSRRRALQFQYLIEDLMLGSCTKSSDIPSIGTARKPTFLTTVSHSSRLSQEPGRPSIVKGRYLLRSTQTCRYIHVERAFGSRAGVTLLTSEPWRTAEVSILVFRQHYRLSFTTNCPPTPRLSNMTSIAAGLNNVLPAPKYPSEEAGSSRPATSRILGAGDVERQQLVLKVNHHIITR